MVISDDIEASCCCDAKQLIELEHGGAKEPCRGHRYVYCNFTLNKAKYY